MSTHGNRKTPENVSVETPGGYKLASTFLGRDFVTPEEVMRARRGVVYTDEQLAHFVETIPTEDVLRWCQENNFVLMPLPPLPLSLLEVRGLNLSLFFSKIGGWYADHAEKFSTVTKTGSGWLLVGKQQLPKPVTNMWDEVRPTWAYVPSAVEMCWMLTTFYEVYGIRLYGSTYVRTSSVATHGKVRLGGFQPQGIGIHFTNESFDMPFAWARTP